VHNFRQHSLVRRTAGALLLASLSFSTVEAATLFVSPTGQAGAKGTATAPFGSLTEAAKRAQPGDVIADGFGAKFEVGPGNVFRGCRVWENADDGFDLWKAPFPVGIENCVAFRNGLDLWGCHRTDNVAGSMYRLRMLDLRLRHFQTTFVSLPGGLRACRTECPDASTTTVSGDNLPGLARLHECGFNALPDAAAV
jgi:hypothetical protein